MSSQNAWGELAKVALRDQPYLPLYVQDFLTDEKLANCSAESTGVYIRLMCLMHKSHEYGKILLRQKWRQSERQIDNFAELLARQMPYSSMTIANALEELIDEEVIYIEDNSLCQKRMIKDAILSEKRSAAGKIGANATNSRSKKKHDSADEFAAAKQSANSENENENESGIENENKNDLNSTIPFSGVLLDAFNEWLSYKAEKRQPYKPRGLKSLITQVQRYAEQFGDFATANAIMDSMASNYQGIVFDRLGKGGKQTTVQRAKAPDEYTTKGSFFDVD